MSDNPLIRWRQGAGWLVLLGGGELDEGDFDGILSDLIAQTDLFRPPLLIPLAGDADGETLLETIQALGGPPGEVLPVLDDGDADDPELARRALDASILILADGDNPLALVSGLHGTELGRALAQAYEAGTSILALGNSAMALGSLVMLSSDSGDMIHVRPGLGWVENAVIEPHFTDLTPQSRLTQVLHYHSDVFGIGLPDRVALALSPAGTVETWGTGGDATIALPPDAPRHAH